MELTINSKTVWEINRYLEKKNPGCLILSGPKHIGKFSMSQIIAKQLLCNDYDGDISVHPDYMCIVPENGTVRIGQIRALKSKAALTCAVSKQKVYVIDDADTMSVSAQNAILKLIEDDNRENIIIFVNHGVLLDTIRSRCTEIIFSPIEKDYGDRVLNLISDGRPGLFMLHKNSEFRNSMEELILCLENLSNPREILECVHGVKEKDKEFFFEKYSKEEMQICLSIMENIFLEAIVKQGISVSTENMEKIYTPERLCQLVEHIAECKRELSVKNKNDFLGLIFEMLV